MTVEELIVYNSTLPANAGWTMLDHLQNIDVNREAVCAIDVDVTGTAVEVEILAAPVAVDVSSGVVEVDVIDGIITVDIDDQEIGVEYGE